MCIIIQYVLCHSAWLFFFFNDTATTEIYTLSLHDALPICHALERDTEAVVVKNGGKVLGKVRHPFPTADFSSFLLQAQASKAKIIGLANAGADTTNAIKQGAEVGIVKGGQQFAGLLVFISDVHALSL